MRPLVVVLLCACVSVPLSALDENGGLRIDTTAGLDLADTVPYDTSAANLFDDLGVVVSYGAPHIAIRSALDLRNDGVFSPEEASYMLGHYMDIRDASITFDLDRFRLAAGRLAHSDVVRSPYSLFISPAARPAMAVDFSFDDAHFFYETRWVQLNYLSRFYVFPAPPNGRLDRGMNYKVYGLKFGDVRFGLQDSIVYVGRSFDAEYFFSPMFQYLQQLVSSRRGRPWAQDNNCNSLNGFFVDVTKPDLYAYAQVLIDDVNMDFLGLWGKLPIATKVAWSLGGYKDLPFGRIGVYTGGATKYTFEATYADAAVYSYYPYEYAYYPASEYTLADGTPMTLPYADNYIGYKYGENALSFLVDYRTSIGPVGLLASVEYVINGSKSPSNPWHELYAPNQLDYVNHSPFYLLDDPQLEHTVLGTVAANFRMGRFEANAAVKLGGRWNSLVLVEAVAGEPKIFRPEGADRFLYEVRLGVTWHFFN